jgi:hypothetical protein
VEKDLEGLGVRRHHHELRYPPVQGLRRWEQTEEDTNLKVNNPKLTELSAENVGKGLIRYLRWRPSLAACSWRPAG